MLCFVKERKRGACCCCSFGVRSMLEWYTPRHPTNKASFLKVALQDSACDASVSVARVLFVDGLELLVSRSLGGKNLTSNWHDFFFAVMSVLEQSRAPSISPYRSAGNIDGTGGKLAGEIVQEIEGLKSSIENETGQLNNLLVGMAGL
jgi:hypothetical protein